MTEDDKPKESKNVCYRRGLTPPPAVNPSTETSGDTLVTNEYQDLLKKYLPYVITLMLLFFIAMKVKSCVTPERHVPVNFTYSVSTDEQLKASLNNAKNKHKPVMIEFYASWCGYCTKLEKEYLSLESVQNGLNKFVTIQMDVSDQNEEQVKIMRDYNVGGTPTLIFIDKSGNVDATVYFTSNIQQDIANEVGKLS